MCWFVLAYNWNTLDILFIRHKCCQVSAAFGQPLWIRLEDSGWLRAVVLSPDNLNSVLMKDPCCSWGTCERCTAEKWFLCEGDLTQDNVDRSLVGLGLALVHLLGLISASLRGQSQWICPSWSTAAQVWPWVRLLMLFRLIIYVLCILWCFFHLLCPWNLSPPIFLRVIKNWLQVSLK